MNELQLVLEEALVVAGRARSIERELGFQILKLRDAPETALNELRRLMAVIQGLEKFAIFETSGDEGFLSLIYWLISRGQQVGSRQATEGLAHFLGADVIEVKLIAGIDGASVQKPIRFGDYELMAWRDLQLSGTKYTVGMGAIFGRKLPTTAVVYRTQVQKSVALNPVSYQCAFLSAFEALCDLLRCAGVVSCAGIRMLTTWIKPDERAPLTVALTWFGIDSTVFSDFVDIGRVSQSEISQCFESFGKLDEGQKNRLRLPLDRLNKSFLCAIRPVESAIELGIAVESLFAPCGGHACALCL